MNFIETYLGLLVQVKICKNRNLYQRFLIRYTFNFNKIFLVIDNMFESARLTHKRWFDQCVHCRICKSKSRN